MHKIKELEKNPEAHGTLQPNREEECQPHQTHEEEHQAYTANEEATFDQGRELQQGPSSHCDTFSCQQFDEILDGVELLIDVNILMFLSAIFYSC